MRKKELIKALRNVGDEAEIIIATPDHTDVKSGLYNIGRVTDLGTKGTSIYDEGDAFFIEIGEEYKQH